MAAERLDARLRKHFPSLAVGLEDNEPAGYRLVVSATPLGMSVGDPLPFDPARLDGDAFVGDVVLTATCRRLSNLWWRLGCRYQVGTDMLFEHRPHPGGDRLGMLAGADVVGGARRSSKNAIWIFPSSSTRAIRW
jgi:hypothetical protein